MAQQKPNDNQQDCHQRAQAVDESPPLHQLNSPTLKQRSMPPLPAVMSPYPACSTPGSSTIFEQSPSLFRHKNSAAKAGSITGFAGAETSGIIDQSMSFGPAHQFSFQQSPVAAPASGANSTTARGAASQLASFGAIPFATSFGANAGAQPQLLQGQQAPLQSNGLSWSQLPVFEADKDSEGDEGEDREARNTPIRLRNGRNASSDEDGHHSTQPVGERLEVSPTTTSPTQDGEGSGEQQLQSAQLTQMIYQYSKKLPLKDSAQTKSQRQAAPASKHPSTSPIKPNTKSLSKGGGGAGARAMKLTYGSTDTLKNNGQSTAAQMGTPIKSRGSATAGTAAKNTVATGAHYLHPGYPSAAKRKTSDDFTPQTSSSRASPGASHFSRGKPMAKSAVSMFSGGSGMVKPSAFTTSAGIVQATNPGQSISQNAGQSVGQLSKNISQKATSGKGRISYNNALKQIAVGQAASTPSSVKHSRVFSNGSMQQNTQHEGVNRAATSGKQTGKKTTDALKYQDAESQPQRQSRESVEPAQAPGFGGTLIDQSEGHYAPDQGSGLECGGDQLGTSNPFDLATGDWSGRNQSDQEEAKTHGRAAPGERTSNSAHILHFSSHLKQFYEQKKTAHLGNNATVQAPDIARNQQKSADRLRTGHRQAVDAYGEKGGNMRASAGGKAVKASTLKQNSSLRSLDNLMAVNKGSQRKLASKDAALYEGQTPDEVKMKRSSFVSTERTRPTQLIREGYSPNRRFAYLTSGGFSSNTNKLHEKVAWFYRRLCEEYECPILPQFVQETIPSAFKSSNSASKAANARLGLGARRESGQSANSGSALFGGGKQRGPSHSPRISPRSQIGKNLLGASVAGDAGKKFKKHSGVVQMNTCMLSDRTVQAVCDTLRRFQPKIKVLELYHNYQEGGQAPGSSAYSQATPSSTQGLRLGSPHRNLGGASAMAGWSFPKFATLIQLLKSLTKATTVKIVCDADCPNFINEGHYQALVNALSRPKKDIQASQGEETGPQKKSAHQLLNTIDIQGFAMKPSFVRHLVESITANRMANLVALSLQNCQIQDAEGQELCKVVILGKKTPSLKSLSLSKNQLGFKFGAKIIAQLIDAQSIAQEETMKAVTEGGSAAPDRASTDSQANLLKFESLDHFSIETIDLEYNKLSFLVIQTVEKLLNNLHQFKEQAKFHQNLFQMQRPAQTTLSQQGSTGFFQNQDRPKKTSQKALTISGFTKNSQYDMQPNKVIIEQTEESSLTSGSSLVDSIDEQDLPRLFQDFIAQQSGRRQGRTPSKQSRHNGLLAVSLSGYSLLPNHGLCSNAQGAPTPSRPHQHAPIRLKSADNTTFLRNSCEAVQVVKSLNEASAAGGRRDRYAAALSPQRTRAGVNTIGVEPLETESQKFEASVDRGQEHCLDTEPCEAVDEAPGVDHASILSQQPDEWPFTLALQSSLQAISRSQVANPQSEALPSISGSLNISIVPREVAYQDEADRTIKVVDFLNGKQSIGLSEPKHFEKEGSLLDRPRKEKNNKVKQYVSPTRLPTTNSKLALSLSKGVLPHTSAKAHQTTLSSVKASLQALPRVSQGNIQQSKELLLTPPQKPLAQALKDVKQAEHTAAQIGNFMDPQLIKARTQISLKLPQSQISPPQQDSGAKGKASATQTAKKHANATKRQTRNRLEGYFSTQSRLQQQAISSLQKLPNAAKSSLTSQEPSFPTPQFSKEDDASMIEEQHSRKSKHETIRGSAKQLKKEKTPKLMTLSLQTGRSRTYLDSHNSTVRKSPRNGGKKGVRKAKKSSAKAPSKAACIYSGVTSAQKSTPNTQNTPEQRGERHMTTATLAEKVSAANGQDDILVMIGSNERSRDANLVLPRQKRAFASVRNSYTAIRDLSPGSAPNKPVALTKSVSAYGDQVSDSVIVLETDEAGAGVATGDDPITSALPAFGPQKPLINLNMIIKRDEKGQVKSHGLQSYLNPPQAVSPSQLLSPSSSGRRVPIQSTVWQGQNLDALSSKRLKAERQKKSELKRSKAKVDLCNSSQHTSRTVSENSQRAGVMSAQAPGLSFQGADLVFYHKRAQVEQLSPSSREQKHVVKSYLASALNSSDSQSPSTDEEAKNIGEYNLRSKSEHRTKNSPVSISDQKSPLTVHLYSYPLDHQAITGQQISAKNTTALRSGPSTAAAKHQITPGHVRQQTQELIVFDTGIGGQYSPLVLRDKRRQERQHEVAPSTTNFFLQSKLSDDSDHMAARPESQYKRGINDLLMANDDYDQGSEHGPPRGHLRPASGTFVHGERPGMYSLEMPAEETNPHGPGVPVESSSGQITLEGMLQPDLAMSPGAVLDHNYQSVQSTVTVAQVHEFSEKEEALVVSNRLSQYAFGKQGQLEALSATKN